MRAHPDINQLTDHTVEIHFKAETFANRKSNSNIFSIYIINKKIKRYTDATQRTCETGKFPDTICAFFSLRVRFHIEFSNFAFTYRFT